MKLYEICQNLLFGSVFMWLYVVLRVSNDKGGKIKIRNLWIRKENV